MPALDGRDCRYFDKKQVEAVKAVRDRLVARLDEKPAVEQMAREAGLSPAVFHTVFAAIYGDTPYAYLKKFKMNAAACALLESRCKVCDLALELGYSNASKFARAFCSVYGVLPRDYRKKKK